MSIFPVIMARVSGSRLWQVSRAAHPKQFLRLHGEYTMLQETFLCWDPNRLKNLNYSLCGLKKSQGLFC